MDESPSITCPVCAKTSYHPQDIKHGWCAYCERYTTDTGKPMSSQDYVQRKVDALNAEVKSGSPWRWFQCAACGDLCLTRTTEAEANREFLASGLPNDSSGIASVCDECYERAMARAEALGLLNKPDV